MKNSKKPIYNPKAAKKSELPNLNKLWIDVVLVLFACFVLWIVDAPIWIPVIVYFGLWICYGIGTLGVFIYQRIIRKKYEMYLSKKKQDEWAKKNS